MSVTFCPDDIFSVCPIVSAQYLLNRSNTFFLSFSTTFGMVVYYHEAMCPAENLVTVFNVKVTAGGLHNQNMTIFTISSKLLVRLEPNWVS